MNIASLLPTSPNPRMAGAVAGAPVRPGQQLIQLRPGGATAAAGIRLPNAPGNIVQIRPPVSIRPTGTSPAQVNKCKLKKYVPSNLDDFVE